MDQKEDKQHCSSTCFNLSSCWNFNSKTRVSVCGRSFSVERLLKQQGQMWQIKVNTSSRNFFSFHHLYPNIIRSSECSSALALTSINHLSVSVTVYNEGLQTDYWPPCVETFTQRSGEICFHFTFTRVLNLSWVPAGFTWGKYAHVEENRLAEASVPNTEKEWTHLQVCNTNHKRCLKRTCTPQWVPDVSRHKYS